MTPVLTASLCYLGLNGFGYLFGTSAAMGLAVGLSFMSAVYLVAGGAKAMTSPDTTRTAYGNEIREAPYVLIKHGLYWRPEAQGYTGVLAEAGRYTLDKVRPYLEDPAYEVKVQLASEADEFAPACWEETKFRVLKNEIAQLQAERDSLRIRLQEAERERAWLTIESAPKDRTKVLLRFAPPFHDSLETGIVTGVWTAGGWWLSSIWASTNAHKLPTHWQPLPTPLPDTHPQTAGGKS